MTECVLCDWQMDWGGFPWHTYRAGEWLPLRWDPESPDWIREVFLSEAVTPESVAAVALVTHWAEEHRGQLEGILGGPVEIDRCPRVSV